MEGGIFKSKHRHDKTKPISAGKKYIFFPSIKQVLLKIKKLFQNRIHKTHFL